MFSTRFFLFKAQFLFTHLTDFLDSAEILQQDYNLPHAKICLRSSKFGCGPTSFRYVLFMKKKLKLSFFWVGQR